MLSVSYAGKLVNDNIRCGINYCQASCLLFKYFVTKIGKGVLSVLTLQPGFGLNCREKVIYYWFNGFFCEILPHFDIKPISVAQKLAELEHF